MFGYVVPRRGGGSLQSAGCSHLVPGAGHWPAGADSALPETNRGINGDNRRLVAGVDHGVRSVLAPSHVTPTLDISIVLQLSDEAPR